MRTTTKARAAGLGFAVVTSTVVLALAPLQCSSKGTSVPEDGAADGVLRDHLLLEGLGDDGPCFQPPDDAGRVSDWPGWRRLTELDPCCAADVPEDVAVALPPYDWVPCLNGAVGCREFMSGWRPGAPQFYTAVASVDASSKLLFVLVGRLLAETVFEQDVYNASTGEALGGWRSDLASPPCQNGAGLVETGVTLVGLRDDGVYLAHGGPQAVAASPLYQRIGPNPNHIPPANLDATTPIGLGLTLPSTTTWAYEIPLAGLVGRTSIGSGTYVTATGPDNFHLALVVGDDVFAWSESGAAGWGQLYLVNAAGALVLFRSNPNAHVAQLRTDGRDLYWTETYGTQDVTAPQQHTEVWTAPYTNDPAALTATAKKIGDVPNTMYPIDSIAFGGIYAFQSFAEKAAILVRASDGAVLHVAGPGSYIFWDPNGLVYVSENELWALAGAAPPDGGTDPGHLVRVALTDW
jgi:hypothetical protein